MPMAYKEKQTSHNSSLFSIDLCIPDILKLRLKSMLFSNVNRNLNFAPSLGVHLLHNSVEELILAI